MDNGCPCGLRAGIVGDDCGLPPLLPPPFSMSEVSNGDFFWSGDNSPGGLFPGPFMVMPTPEGPNMVPPVEELTVGEDPYDDAAGYEEETTVGGDVEG